MLSPMDMMSLNRDDISNSIELFDLVQKISRVDIPKKHRSSKEAGFLYWTLGNYEKIPTLFLPEFSFYSLYNLLFEL